MFSVLLQVRNFMDKCGKCFGKTHVLFSVCYCKKLSEGKLIGSYQVMIPGKGLKTSLLCLHKCDQFLHMCCTYLRLAKCVNPGCWGT